jgi:hypothetical protein
MCGERVREGGAVTGAGIIMIRAFFISGRCLKATGFSAAATSPDGSAKQGSERK